MDTNVQSLRSAEPDASAAHQTIEVDVAELQAKIFTCSHCSQHCRAVQYRCLACPDVSYCGDCYTTASEGHPGHDFTRRDAAARIADARASGGSGNIRGSSYRLSVPRSGCPTCFNQRPDRLVNFGAAIGNTSVAPSYWKSRHDLFTSDFHVSFQNGCQLCALVHRGLTTLGSAYVGTFAPLELTISPEAISLQISSSLSNIKTYATIRPRIGSSPSWKTMTPGPRYHRSFKAPESFQRLCSWLHECKTQHVDQRCREDLDKTHAGPGRLLYVGSNLDSSHVRLLTTSDTVYPYIALTHCWGTQTLMKTTRSNLNAFHNSIDLETLPQTFKDAVMCARGIGVEHAWVDALCIVQDDVSDWERESAKMGNIYRKAAVVVVADSSPQAAAGFLGERPLEYTGLPIEEPGELSDCHEFAIYKSMDHKPGYTASRAWCLQEVVLARRCVFFNNDEMRWECNSLVSCECEHNLSPFVFDEASRSPRIDFIGLDLPKFFDADIDMIRRLSDHLALDLSTGRPFQNPDSAENVYADWRLRVVNTYTKMKLTRATDRLPALSGVVSDVAQYLQDRYLAGLWLGDLPLGLLWYVDHDNGDPRPAPSQYYGPSFSWVSVDGLAKYAYLEHAIDGKSILKSEILTTLDAKCHAPGLNPYGEITDGHVRLFARLKSSVLSKVTTEGEYLVQDEGWGRYRCAFVPDTCLTAVEVAQSGTEATITTAARASQSSDVPFSAPVDLMIVGVAAGRNLTIYALLVLGISPTKKGAYERLGILQVWVDERALMKSNWDRFFERREVVLV